MRRYLLLLLLPFFALGLNAQNRESLGELTIGMVGRDRENPIYHAAQRGAKDAAEQLEKRYSIEIDLINLTPNLSQGETQNEALSQLFIENADGLIISPSDPEALRPAIEFAHRHGQALVFFEHAVDGFDPLTSVLADETEAGRLAGKNILPRLPTGGRVAILTSDEATPAMVQRLAGAREALGYRRIETIVETAPDYRSAIAAIRAAEESDRNDHIKGWVFLGDWPLIGMPALPWKPGELPVVVIQSSPAALVYIDQGYIDAFVVHPYYEWGFASMEILVQKLFRDIDPERPIVKTTPELIDWQNLAIYRENWKKWLK